MTWDDTVILMKHESKEAIPGQPTPLQSMLIEFLEEDLDDGYVTGKILPSKYDYNDVREMAQQQTYLTPSQRNDLEAIFLEHQTLFNGQLKKYTGGQVHLNINPNAKPHYSYAYPTAHKHLEVFKMELYHLVDQDVLEKAPRSAWIAGTFIIPKKDSRVHWISDFRALNRAIYHQVYPIPLISDVIRCCQGYKFLTKNNLSMQFYTFQLDEESRAYTTIATPFGLYRYKHLPMGVCESPDIAQKFMETVLASLLDEIEVYLDDLAAFSNSWEEHCVLLCKLSKKLSFWATGSLCNVCSVPFVRDSIRFVFGRPKPSLAGPMH